MAWPWRGMARRVFYSFDHRDSHRVARIKNINAVHGQTILQPNEWEKIRAKGNATVQRWIDDNMKNRGVVIVLIGERTSKRKWVKYEIKKGWTDGKALLGIYIHKLKDLQGNTTSKGANPFSQFHVNGRLLSGIVDAKSCPYQGSASCYNYIAANIGEWVEDAVEIRRQYPGSRV